MPTEIQVIPSTIPEGFCHQNWQETFNTFAASLVLQIAGGLAFINYGVATPGVDFRDRPWVRLNTDGSFRGIYVFRNGRWETRIFSAPPGAVMAYDGDIANVPTLDGGETDDPAWLVCDGTNGTRDLRHRTIRGAGPAASASGSIPALAQLDFGAVGGEETHVQTTAELAAHVHTEEGVTVATVAGGGPFFVPAATQVQQNTGSTGGSSPFNVLDPYAALYWIKRTTKLYTGV